MLLTVDEFRTRVRRDMNGLIRALQERTARTGAAERDAWMASLPTVADALSHPALESLHVALRDRRSLSLEYRLPGAGSWCDLVLLGRGGEDEAKPAAVIVELKHWNLSGTRPGPRPGLIEHHGSLVLHPSEQVRGYVEYCRHFHSAVIDHDGDVEGCTLLTNSQSTVPLELAPHDHLVREYPVFHAGSSDLRDRVAGFVRRTLHVGDDIWAQAFEDGTYKQDRSFVRMVAGTIAREDQTHLVLLDAQRRGFEHCLAEIDALLRDRPQDKLAIIIEGPPGSGKSVLAAKLWAALTQDDRLAGNSVIVATSTSQRSNWESLVIRATGYRRAMGVVKRTADFNPGITTQWVVNQRKNGETIDIHQWRATCDLARRSITPRLLDNSIAVSVVDEAHALIDPTAPGKNGISPSGWTHHAGPQAFHIMRASRVSVFLLDPDQSYRDNETTSPDTIHRLAVEAGVSQTRTIHLTDSQFRCGGSTEFVEWAERMLEGSEVPPHCAPSRWRDRPDQPGFIFELVDDPAALDERLREHMVNNHTARLAASYARKWTTKPGPKSGIINPHEAPEDKHDFQISFTRHNRTHHWTRVWNYIPEGTDYQTFIQAPDGSAIRRDSLCEVGCPYVLRGFDFDFIGLLWLSDLVRRDNRWVPQLEHVHESALRLTVSKARAALQPKQPRKGKGKPIVPVNYDDAAAISLLKQLQRGYRILLTRAIRGVYVWCEDEETREYLRGCLGR